MGTSEVASEYSVSKTEMRNLLREIDSSGGPSSIIGDENFWLQLLDIQNLSDENAEDFKKRKSIMKRTFSSNLVQLIILHHVKNCLKNYLDLDFTN